MPLNLSSKEVNDNENLNDKMNDNHKDCKRILAYIVQNEQLAQRKRRKPSDDHIAPLTGYCYSLSTRPFFISSGTNRNKSYRLKTTSGKM